MRIWKERYQELEKAALSSDATQEDINALGKWFELYGERYWDGESYRVTDDIRIVPIDIEDEDGDFRRVGWELR